jgi:predicted phage-related endonuclease
MAISEEQESWAISRVGGLGGTDVTAILGLSKWRTPIEVWQAKVDPASVPAIDSEILWFGRALEPVIRARYAIHFNCEVVNPCDIGAIFPNSTRWEDQTIVRGRESWMLGTADGWTPADRSGLEAKNVGFKTDEWGDEETADIPAAYFCQSSWYNLVYDAARWNVVPLFSGHKLSRYIIPRDAQFEKDCYEVARVFWHDYVIPRIEPPIDQTESYGRYLAKRFSLGTGIVITDPSPEILEQTAIMKLASADKKGAEDRERLANNNLRALVGDAQKAITPMGTVGWIRPEEKEVTDWDAVGKKIGPLHPEVVAEFTEKAQRAASFRAWWKK